MCKTGKQKGNNKTIKTSYVRHQAALLGSEQIIQDNAYVVGFDTTWTILGQKCQE